ncbi:MAG: hypothetical protein OEM42_07715 [Deltaproteobacteria bacterium]|nr:hypothetical protein [Deltaproteobacteria bacterium]
MEGILLEGVTTGTAVAGVLILVAVVAGALLAQLSEEEMAGAIFTWAEWPLPETEKPALPAEEEIEERRAA